MGTTQDVSTIKKSLSDLSTRTNIENDVFSASILSLSESDGDITTEASKAEFSTKGLEQEDILMTIQTINEKDITSEPSNSKHEFITSGELDNDSSTDILETTKGVIITENENIELSDSNSEQISFQDSDDDVTMDGFNAINDFTDSSQIIDEFDSREKGSEEISAGSFAAFSETPKALSTKIIKFSGEEINVDESTAHSSIGNTFTFYSSEQGDSEEMSAGSFYMSFELPEAEEFEYMNYAEKEEKQEKDTYIHKIRDNTQVKTLVDDIATTSNDYIKSSPTAFQSTKQNGENGVNYADLELDTYDSNELTIADSVTGFNGLIHDTTDDSKEFIIDKSVTSSNGIVYENYSTVYSDDKYEKVDEIFAMAGKIERNLDFSPVKHARTNQLEPIDQIGTSATQLESNRTTTQKLEIGSATPVEATTISGKENDPIIETTPNKKSEGEENSETSEKTTVSVEEKVKKPIIIKTSDYRLDQTKNDSKHDIIEETTTSDKIVSNPKAETQLPPLQNISKIEPNDKVNEHIEIQEAKENEENIKDDYDYEPLHSGETQDASKKEHRNIKIEFNNTIINFNIN